MAGIQYVNRVKKEQQLCDDFNRMYAEGTLVKYWTGVKEGEPSGIGKTRSTAQMMCGHSVVWIEGYRSCVGLSHIEVAE